MTDAEPAGTSPLDQLPAHEKRERAGSFGHVAAHYRRFRPGPPDEAVDWLLPERVGTVVDLGAGTGALTGLLTPRADEVIAVEPDGRMRSILTDEVPSARVLEGRGDSMPIPDGTVDAVLASSSWHWMDLLPTLNEVRRVLVPDGVLGAVWSGPDRDGRFLSQAFSEAAGGPEAELKETIVDGTARQRSVLHLPPGAGFEQPHHEVFRWDVALNADELIGLRGTFSRVILLPEDDRTALFDRARRRLRDLLGVEGDVTTEVAFRADAWRAERRG